jgi:hypothetical protein
MGLPLISEAPSIPISFLDDLLSKAKNIIRGGASFRPAGQVSTELLDLIKKSVKTSFSSLSEEGWDNIVQRILRGEKNIPGMDYASLAKNLVSKSDVMVKAFDDYVKNSAKELAKTSVKIKDYTAKLPELLVKKPDLYDEAVNELIKIRNAILALDIDETLKTTYLNRYGLMDVMTRKAEQETVKRQNIIVKSLNDIYTSLKPQRLSDTEYRFSGSGLNLTQGEYDLLKKVVLGEENWFTTTIITDTLRKELINALEKSEGTASLSDEYYKGILLKLGYIKNLEDTIEFKYGSQKFLLDVYNMSEKLGIDVGQTLKNFIKNEDEISLVLNSVESQVKTLGPLFSKAVGTSPIKNNSFKLFLKSGAFGKIQNLIKLKLRRPYEFFRVIQEITGSKSVAEEASEEIEKNLKIIAANNLSETYQNTTPQWETVFNQLARINQGISDMNQKTREIFDKLISEDSAFKNDPALKTMLLNDPSIEELIKSVSELGTDRAWKAAAIRIMAYLRVVPLSGLIVTGVKNGKVTLKEAFVDLPAQWLTRVGRTALLADPISQGEYRTFMSFAGTKGIWVDKLLHLLVISGLVVPFIEAYKEDAKLETIRERELTKWKLIHENMCTGENTKMTAELDPEFCNNAQNLITQLTPEAANRFDLFWNNLPIIGDNGNIRKVLYQEFEGLTGLDEVVNFIKPVDTAVGKSGYDAGLEAIKNYNLLGIEQQVSTELEKLGWDKSKSDADNLKTINTILTENANLKRNIGPSHKGFLSFCLLNKYNMVDYDDGFGIAEVDGVKKTFEYKRFGNTFKLKQS